MITFNFSVEDTVNGKITKKEIGFSKSQEITVENVKKLLEVADDCDLMVLAEPPETAKVIEKEPDLAMIKNGCQLKISRKSDRIENEFEAIRTPRNRRDAFYRPPPPAIIVPPTGDSGSSSPNSQTKCDKFKGTSSRFRVGYADTIGKRPTMEDSVVLFGNFREKEDEDLFCVFDGHAGSEASNFVAENIPSVFASLLGENEKQPEEMLKSAFHTINEDLRKKEIRGGTTALVSLILEENIYIANCGDTRAVLYNGGEITRCSVDHKPGLEKEEKRVKDLGGKVTFDVDKFGNIVSRINGKLSVSRALGDFELEPFIMAEPDINEPISLKDLKPNSFLILACDGLWDLLGDEEAASLVSGISDPEEAACKLRDIAYTSGSTDNITVIVIRFPPFVEQDCTYNIFFSIVENLILLA